jgi:hypothetical protein
MFKRINHANHKQTMTRLYLFEPVVQKSPEGFTIEPQTQEDLLKSQIELLLARHH